jgi:hypothetical protein
MTDLGRQRSVESKLRAILQPDPWYDIGTLQFIGHQKGKFRRANCIPKQKEGFHTLCTFGADARKAERRYLIVLRRP